MQVDSASITDTGGKRPHNEDFVLAWVPNDPTETARFGSLYIVADGVGGGAAGEVASRYAAEAVLYYYFAGDATDHQAKLERAIEQVSREIYDYNEAHPEQRSMGTTMVAALVCNDEMIVANVGDSRAYLVHEDSIEQITRDHNVVARMLDQGEISEEEAASHPWRNRLTRCLGIDPEISVDIFTPLIQVNDRFVLCSDGLCRHVSDAEIASIVTQGKLEAAARQLVNLANSRGGEDNISVLLLQLLPDGVKLKQGRKQPLPAPDLETTYHETTAKKRRFWPFKR